ncbi:hypothetical protein B0J13DRAFT_609758 [Dactylonectria estremocensis]|uniref:BZIP domain-containing protein n=1 Tax=Dactylonectria estremocensis TaxID=1079267 RepID=A0A9P9EH10_9HYPO|nr:hypothetical protein B0J13DRAFT_609758 [Dactylonectria estremocensis]
MAATSGIGALHLGEAVGREDDWSGITDPKERRKRQNRLHQRTWRRRQVAQQGSRPKPAAPGVHVIRLKRQTEPGRAHQLFPMPPSRMEHRISNPSPPNSDSGNAGFTSTAWPAAAIVPLKTDRGHEVALPLRTSIPEPLRSPSPHISPSTKQLHALLRDSGPNNSVPRALLSRAFPLSADHKLITLVQYNVLRGMITNILILSLQDFISTDCGYNLKIPPLPYAPPSPPANFKPTQIQQTIQHGVWIDMIPSPEFRDNLILNQHLYDGDDLCDDLVGGLYEGFDDVNVRGMMLWGDPWFEDGWEMSEGFVNKWGFLLKGCKRMVESTDRWRERRGEGRLVFEV